MRRIKRLVTGRSADNVWRAGVWALIAAYFLYFGVLTVQKHNAFQTTAFDLGNVDQAVWNTRHGRLLALTNIEGLTNRLGTHVEPILVPVSLLYFLWSDPRALLLLQTAVIALGAWPLYLIARRAVGVQSSGTPNMPYVSPLRDHALPITFVLVYLFFPALESANVFDFHAVALAPTFFLFAFYYLLTERWGKFALFAVLIMSCKEDAPLLVVMLGLYLLAASRGKWRIALPTIAVAMTWFIVAVGVIMPHFDTGGVSPFANRYAWLGDGPVEMAIALLTRPGLVVEHALTAENLAYLRDWLAPVAWLPILAPLELLLAAPLLAVNLLSTDGFMHQLEGFHYGALLAPVAVVAAAYGAARLIRRLPHFRPLPSLIVIVVLTTTLVYHIGHGYTPLAAGLAPGVAGGVRSRPAGPGNGPTGAGLRLGGGAALPQPPRQPAALADDDREGRKWAARSPARRRVCVAGRDQRLAAAPQRSQDGGREPAGRRLWAGRSRRWLSVAAAQRAGQDTARRLLRFRPRR